MNDYATPGVLVQAADCENCWGLVVLVNGTWRHVDAFCGVLVTMRAECRPEDVAFWSDQVDAMLDGAQERRQRPAQRDDVDSLRQWATRGRS